MLNIVLTVEAKDESQNYNVVVQSKITCPRILMRQYGMTLPELLRAQGVDMFNVFDEKLSEKDKDHKQSFKNL